MRIETFRALAKSSIKVDWIVEDFISPGGWTFLVGETKTGKSMLMIQLCNALQTGTPFLGMKTRKSNCLYIQADAALIEWKVQIERLAPESMAWTAHQIERGFLDNSSERERLYQLVWGEYSESSPMYKVLGGKPFDFVIFDCLHAITNGDLNTKTAMSQVLKHLEEITTRVSQDEKGENVIEEVHYLLVHHPNAMVKRGAVAGSGHKGFSDACTTKLTLGSTERSYSSKKEPGSGLLILEGSKIASRKEILLERNEVGAWYLQEDELKDFDYSSILGEK